MKETEFHVGCGLCGIYAGTLKTETQWAKKSDVTNEALCAVADYLLANGKGIKFSLDGKNYKLCVVEITGETE